MTVYEMIQELVGFPADAKIVFAVGNLETDTCDCKEKKYCTGSELKIELT